MKSIYSIHFFTTRTHQILFVLQSSKLYVQQSSFHINKILLVSQKKLSISHWTKYEHRENFFGLSLTKLLLD